MALTMFIAGEDEAAVSACKTEETVCGSKYELTSKTNERGHTDLILCHNGRHGCSP